MTSRAAIDDMLGKFEKTSEAYFAGKTDGATQAHKKARAVVERAMWGLEGREDRKIEFDIMKRFLAEMDKISS